MSDAVRKLHLTGSDSLQVEGQNDLLVYRARCCNPIRGEEIVGYVTRGKGVAVHARGCPNVQNLLYESDRRIDVEWSRVGDETAGRPQRYPVKITVSCDDRAGMLKELIAVISDDNANISGVDIRHDENGEAIIEFIAEAEDVRPPEPHGSRPAPRLRRPRRAPRAKTLSARLAAYAGWRCAQRPSCSSRSHRFTARRRRGLRPEHLLFRPPCVGQDRELPSILIPGTDSRST